MKTFIAIVFLMNTGEIVAGNDIDGFPDLEQDSWEVCIERSKWFYKNKEKITFGPRAKDAVTFCYRK